ncbi:MAG TPA: amidohydrolase family protein [Candidatus Acidoferrales bacterium]|nr:amidohydrolase family protein [Candidatus Acidoferrales bacterium]
MRRSAAVAFVFIFSAFLAARLGAQQGAVSPGVMRFVKVSAPVVALEHVRVIDGSGAEPKDDQTVILSGGKIQSIGDSKSTAAPDGAKVLDLTGNSVIPGLVGMHEHMFYPSGKVSIYNEMGFSFPRLYLAAGVTTARTAGSIEPYSDLELKKEIDAGHIPGPEMRVTGPYLEGRGSFTLQMHELKDADDARRTVDYWADEGVTSFKAYMHITRAELSAAIEEAHKRGIKVTGHLCSIGFREAAALGIDDLEHGLLVDTEFNSNKKPDECNEIETYPALVKLDLDSAPVKDMIQDLVNHHVAVTSTLPVFETFVPDRPPLESRVLDAMTPQAQIDYLAVRANIGSRGGADAATLLKKELDFERAFVKAGGLLIAGEDPTGYGGDLAGFGDQREVELLVEAGFTPLEAIHICTVNGAQYLGESDRIGTLAPGKAANLVVIHGDPSKSISDVEKVEIVFKEGIGYDSAALIESVRGSVGLH